MTSSIRDFADVRRLLIFRTGSIGDTVTALPVFHLLRRAFPGAERRVLTNFPINSDAAALQSVLGEAEFVHGYFRFPAAMRSPGRIAGLAREIADWQPNLAVYLRERRSAAPLWRDLAFLRLAGLRRVLAVPRSRDLRRNRGPDADGLWEAEARRLARMVAAIGDARPGDAASWDLALTAAEAAQAAALLGGGDSGKRRFIAFAVGAKIDVKDWGDTNWRRVLTGLGAEACDHGLVLIGGAGDSARANAIAESWRGPVVDLCGRAGPRISALAIRGAALLLCHDSGPMHLAAAVGTPAVAVFSTHAKPGVWFPFGAAHRVFYPGLAWSGGDPPVLRDAAGEANITQIPPDQVLDAARTLLVRTRARL